MYQYYEYKYLVDMRDIESLKNILEALYGGSDPYSSGWVSSVYFDSLDRRSIQECADGQEIKRKFRIRAYDLNLESNLHLQIKEKNLSAIKKYKYKHNGVIDRWPDIGQVEDSAIASLSAQYCNLEPIIRIDYKRHRYKVFDYRVTFDESIRFFAKG